VSGNIGAEERAPHAGTRARYGRRAPPIPPPRDGRHGWGRDARRPGTRIRLARARARAHARGRWRGAEAGASIRLVSEHPRCVALRHGGRRCRSAAAVGSAFCEHHSARAAERGAEVVKRGEFLRAPVGRGAAQEPMVAETNDIKVGQATAAPLSIRRRCGPRSRRQTPRVWMRSGVLLSRRRYRAVSNA